MGKTVATYTFNGLLFSLLVCSAGCTEAPTSEAMPAASNSKTGTLLRIEPLQAPLKFHIVRKERTLKNNVPQYKKNMDLSFDLTIKRVSGDDYQIKPSNGDGIDLERKQSNHLKKMTALISKEILSITIGEKGAATDPQFSRANDTGWAGAIALKAFGEFEHGFLDTMLPDDKIEAGAKWFRDVDFAEEAKLSDANAAELFPNIKRSIRFDQTGPKAEYTLVKIESVGGRKIAEISYNSSGTVKVDSQHSLTGDMRYQQDFTEKGTIKLDAKTGWPLEFKMVRTVDTQSETNPSIEESTTIVKRI